MSTGNNTLRDETGHSRATDASSSEFQIDDLPADAQVAEALASMPRAQVEGMLHGLPRDSLKALCRALHAEGSGRKKADLVTRILAAIATTGSDVAPSAEPSQVSEPPRPTVEKLSVAELERHLWAAANILRGQIDSGDYKTYIFGLLFLKRLSDQFEEEAEKLIAEGVSEHLAWTDPDEHEFFVPDRARWEAIRTKATNIGEELNKACAALEEQNTSLEGVLAGIDFNSEQKLGDTRSRDTVLLRLVQHFSEVSLRSDQAAEPDLLGRAYEYLIEQFADDAGKKGGEFYTPRMVVKLIVKLLAPAEGMRICDPTVGSGGMLIECAREIGGGGGEFRQPDATWSREKPRYMGHLQDEHAPAWPARCSYRKGRYNSGSEASR